MNSTPNSVLPDPSPPWTRITLVLGIPPNSKVSRPAIPVRTRLFTATCFLSSTAQTTRADRRPHAATLQVPELDQAPTGLLGQSDQLYKAVITERIRGN